MTINEKLSQLKTTIEELKIIVGNLGNDNALKSKIEEMKKEISRLKKGIEESIDELDRVVGEEEDGRS